MAECLSGWALGCLPAHERQQTCLRLGQQRLKDVPLEATTTPVPGVPDGMGVLTQGKQQPNQSFHCKLVAATYANIGCEVFRTQSMPYVDWKASCAPQQCVICMTWHEVTLYYGLDRFGHRKSAARLLDTLTLRVRTACISTPAHPCRFVPLHCSTHQLNILHGISGMVTAQGWE